MRSERVTTSRRNAAQWRAALCVSLLAAGLGCQSPRVAQPLTQSLPDDPVAAQLEFWHGLENRPVTCNDEAFHGLLLLIDGKDDRTSYDQRVSDLKSRQLLWKKFDRPADEAVQRGIVAVALVRALKIHGGWALSLMGPTPRYATRELIYRNLYPMSSPDQTFSGAEFVGIMAKAEDYMREHGADLSAPAATAATEPVAAK